MMHAASAGVNAGRDGKNILTIPSPAEASEGKGSGLR
jgi:hypothetical protein